MPPEPTNESPRTGERIAKLLARAGVASRREIERMIEDGRIALDGQILTTPATVLTSLRGVTVDGNPVAEASPARLFRFNKPAGVLTTERDPLDRPTIYDRLPKGLPRVMPVGRLDLATEGLLLMTTDGELKRELELPATGVERTYRARAYGNVTQEQLEDLMLGIEIDGVRYGSINANLERRTGANVWIEMTLTEGKNREVRRVLEHLGLQVSRLIRTRYGPFHLGDMPVCGIDEVRQPDLITFRRALSGPGGGKAASALQLSSRLKPVALDEDAMEEAAEAAPAPRRTRREPERPSRALTPRPIPPRDPNSRPKGQLTPRDGDAARTERPRRAAEPKAKTGPEKFGVGQRRRHQVKVEAKARREAEARDPRFVTGKPQANRGATSARPDRFHDDGGPLLDRPKGRGGFGPRAAEGRGEGRRGEGRGFEGRRSEGRGPEGRGYEGRTSDARGFGARRPNDQRPTDRRPDDRRPDARRPDDRRPDDRRPSGQRPFGDRKPGASRPYGGDRPNNDGPKGGHRPGPKSGPKPGNKPNFRGPRK